MVTFTILLWTLGVVLSTLVTEYSCSEKPQIAPLNFIPMKPSAGSVARTYCTVFEGDHPISIVWMHNGKRIEKPEGNIDIKKVDESSFILKINYVDISNIGNFTCVASNDAGFDSQTIELKFEGPPKWLQSPPKGMDVLVGGRTSLTCDTIGYPVPTTAWFLENCG